MSQMRAILSPALAALLGAVLLSAQTAQTPAPKPQFEVASIKPAANNEAAAGRPPNLRELMRNSRRPGSIPMPDPGRVRLEDWALLDLIAAAYGVNPRQVSGPSWIGDQGFDIQARVPEGTPKEQLNAMLQSLLEERFGLVAHRETQTKQGYALVVGKNGPKLAPAAPPPAEDPDLTPEQRQARLKERAQANTQAIMQRMREMREAGTPLDGLSTSRWASITSEELAANLVRYADAPVIDQTGLTGKYSVSIETWKNADVPGGTIFDAVEKLGLKLESRKVTLDTIVVDRVSKMPTEN